MGLKFKETLKDKVVNTAKNVNNDVLTAYDVKRREVEENNIPKWAKDALTPEEISRSQRLGLFVGAVVLVCFMLLVVLIIMGWRFNI